jgi:hypothetical protein
LAAEAKFESNVDQKPDVENRPIFGNRGHAEFTAHFFNLL